MYHNIIYVHTYVYIYIYTYIYPYLSLYTYIYIVGSRSGVFRAIASLVPEYTTSTSDFLAATYNNSV